jgi:hypothetical protein
MSAFIQEINNDEDGNPTKRRSSHQTSTKRKRKGTCTADNHSLPEDEGDTGFSGSKTTEDATDSSGGSDLIEIPNDEVGSGMTYFKQHTLID